MKNLVLIGGGHSHAIALRLFGINPILNIRLILISESPQTPYSGMIPGNVAGFYTDRECHIDLRQLTEFAQVKFIVDKVVDVDLKNRQIFCAKRLPISFDFLSINTGSTPTILSVKGASEYAIAVKPISEFLPKWHRLVEQVSEQPSQPISLGIVGGGAGGVELALTMQAGLHRVLQMAQQPLSNLQIHLFERSAELMENHHQWVKRHMKKLLTRRGIQLHLKESVCEVQPQLVRCESGLVVKCDRLFWVTQASAPNWPKKSGLVTDEAGFILVNNNLQSVSHPHVFAAGDIATIENNPCPKAGVFAVRQGKPLFNNWQRMVEGQTLEPYYPQKRYLSLIGTGDGSAVASWGKYGWESPLLWYLKDSIDRRFMAQFEKLGSE